MSLNKRKWKWIVPICIFFIIVLGICWAENNEPNTPFSQPVLPKKRLSDHLYKPKNEWLSYYDVSNSDSIQVYYNIAVLLDSARRQELKLKNLAERIEILEKKMLVVTSDSGKAAPEPNAASTPANTGESVSEKTTE